MLWLPEHLCSLVRSLAERITYCAESSDDWDERTVPKVWVFFVEGIERPEGCRHSYSTC